ncbi:NAD(P)H-hydrate dehydratase [Nocardioides jiangxiensis]|uniref:Bifunctional NAD(P)H-hydrate repair enzyme n=1 Tax=Nocardioides jiangxiensis TaxID=3064524 RepID=A0ABT9B1I8_9ACTN|nr:NAD(P)H-hydrate dehydratase [Nocardioides sp. WY-20]MDO7868721.1 NAD(P)H-hydrate dehydratase [Nocardioides sp. WY-20]
MRHAHTVAQVRAAEQASPDLGPGLLMQRAARGLAQAVIDLLGGAYGRRVVLLVGSGDNGGDALYAGAVLARRGALVDAWLLGARVHEAALTTFRGAGGRVGTPGPATRGAAHDLVVDGIVGIGGRPGLAPEAIAALEAVSRDALVVAVDVPSGLDADTGRITAPHVEADVTVTFGSHKVAHLVDPAAAACGVVHLVGIGLDLPPAPVEALQAADVAALLPVPDRHAHKYTRGVVGVRAGSSAYPGAGQLCVAGAASGLAGMVRYRPVDDDRETARSVLAAHPEVVTGEGRVQAWVVGSGGGAEAARALGEALNARVPVVIDADALAAVERPLPVPAVLTPHAGELAAMLGISREEVEDDQLAAARRAADRFDAVVVLKGRRTLVAEPVGRVRVNTTGTPWLATAGAGDVLAGLTGSLVAAGLSPFDAASAACWLHGAAASLASAGAPITARAVAAALPEAVRRVLDAR